MEVKLEEVCQGHVLNLCPKCEIDNKNKYCPNYKPIKIQVYDVKDSDKKYMK